MSVHTPTKKKITVQTLIAMKQRGEKISILTAYDFTTARILDEAGIDAILVGDSAANVMAGYDTTVDEMIVYAASVMRGTEHAIVIILVVATVITPTSDVFTLLLVALPMWILYEISIFIVNKTNTGRNIVFTINMLISYSNNSIKSIIKTQSYSKG